MRYIPKLEPYVSVSVMFGCYMRVRTLQQLISSNAMHTEYTNAESRRRVGIDRTLWSSRRSRGLGAPLRAAGCKAELASGWLRRHAPTCPRSKTAVARATKHFTHQGAPQGVFSKLSAYPEEKERR